MWFPSNRARFRHMDGNFSSLFAWRLLFTSPLLISCISRITLTTMTLQWSEIVPSLQGSNIVAFSYQGIVIEDISSDVATEMQTSDWAPRHILSVTRSAQPKLWKTLPILEFHLKRLQSSGDTSHNQNLIRCTHSTSETKYIFLTLQRALSHPLLWDNRFLLSGQTNLCPSARHCGSLKDSWAPERPLLFVQGQQSCIHTGCNIALSLVWYWSWPKFGQQRHLGWLACEWACVIVLVFLLGAPFHILTFRESEVIFVSPQSGSSHFPLLLNKESDELTSFLY